jgi:hypothetical protein
VPITSDKAAESDETVASLPVEQAAYASIR